MRSTKARVVDEVEIELSLRMTKMKLLCQVIVLGDVVSSLSKMVSRSDPWQTVSTEVNFWKISSFLLAVATHYVLALKWGTSDKEGTSLITKRQ